MGLADLILQFGKAPAEHDDRTLEFANILREKLDPSDAPRPPRPPIGARGEGGPPAARPPTGARPGGAPPPGDVALPEEYDFDERFAATLFRGHTRKWIPTPTYGNLKHKNCVIAGRAHQTLRFELDERKRLMKISTRDVMDEFHKQSGGKDKAIPVLPSLKRWRKDGWKVAGKTCKIMAFARINRRDHEKIKRAIQINVGVGLGFFLPDTAITQFKHRKCWEVIRDGGEESKPHFGHYVYVSGYTKDGLICITWGRKQHMTWAFVKKYCDEAYAIIDAIDTPEKKQWLDEKKIIQYLENCDEREEVS